MKLIHEWLTKLFGLRNAIGSEIEQTIFLDTKLAGAIARAELCKDAEEYAAELERTHPQIAAQVRRVLAQCGTTETPELLPPATDPTVCVPAPAKKLRGAKSIPQLPDASPSAD